MIVRNTWIRLLTGTALFAAPALLAPVVAQRQAGAVRIVIPSLPLDEALRRIEAQSGVRIAADPDAIRGMTSAPVDSGSALAAARMAVKSSGLQVAASADGSILITTEITIVARRDEAETDLLVRTTTTSSRTGQTLREQPRNTTVISSKLMAEQQVVTVADALRNAGGVVVNTATVQGGNGYSVRGFSAGGLVNGLPGASNDGTNAGATQPIANIERIEVLKGPDALLAGVANMGGTTNIVTKKPFAGQLLTASAETGSFGQARLTIDANQVLNDAKTLSARVVAVAATADRNFGGYTGNEDYLIAPTVRFADAATDIVIGASAADQLFGSNPYTVLNPTTLQPVQRPRDEPLLSPSQSIRIGSTRLYGDATRKVGSWLTLTLRGQHEDQQVAISAYSPLAIINSAGLAFVAASPSRQRGKTDAVDGFAKITVQTGPVSHLLVLGATKVWSDLAASGASQAQFGEVNILTDRPAAALPSVDQLDYTTNGTQSGQYAQYMIGAWRVKLIAGARRNTTSSTILFPNGFSSTQRSKSVVPNFGAVLDVTGTLSLFGSLAYGYVPNFALDAQGNRLADNETRNIEGGIKFDMFGGRALLNASYFDLRQSNLSLPDPTTPGRSIGLPGQLGRGVDVSITGRITSHWLVQAGYTRTIFTRLTPSEFGDVIVGQPRDQYNLYTSYRRPLGNKVTAGIGGGVYGRSSAAIDSFGEAYSPASLQVDLNAFAQIGPLDLNLGVRNVFDRVNYGTTTSASYIPYGETRNWRLSATYRFW